jgi:hypothetical protein
MTYEPERSLKERLATTRELARRLKLSPAKERAMLRSERDDWRKEQAIIHGMKRQEQRDSPARYRQRQRDLSSLDDRARINNENLDRLLENWNPKDPDAQQKEDELKTDWYWIDVLRSWTATDDWYPLAERPGRAMPSLYDIACYWKYERPGIFSFSLRVPSCFRCECAMPYSGDGCLVPRRKLSAERDISNRWRMASGYLDRAHLVDRSLGYGTDGPQNLVPLCINCHRVMPVFDTDMGGQAIAWVRGF